MKPLLIAISIFVAAALLILSCFPGNTTPLPESSVAPPKESSRTEQDGKQRPAGSGGCKCVLTGVGCLCQHGECNGGDCWNYSVKPITSPQGQWVSRWENRDGTWKWWNYRTAKGEAEATASGCAGGNCNIRGRGAF